MSIPEILVLILVSAALDFCLMFIAGVAARIWHWEFDPLDDPPVRFIFMICLISTAIVWAVMA